MRINGEAQPKDRIYPGLSWLGPLSALLLTVSPFTQATERDPPTTLTDNQADEPDESGELAEATLTLEGGYFWQEKFPALRIHFKREDRPVDTLVVRFPEMIEARDAASGKTLKFYQDNRMPEWPVDLECEPLDAAPKWEGNETELGYTMRFDNGMLLHSTARVDGDALRLTHSLENATRRNLQNVRMWNCVQLITTPGFADRQMERTSVPIQGKRTLMRSQCPGSPPYTDEQAAYHRFLAYTKGAPRWFQESPSIHPHPGIPDDPEKATVFEQVTPDIDRPTISTTSRDGRWIIQTSARETQTVWSNPGITCHHSDEVVPACAPGKKARVHTTVRFLRTAL